MAIDHAERILNIFVISHGFVTLNFRHHWKWWQTTLFVLAVGFSAFGFLREVGNFAIGYSRSKSIGKGIVGSAIFWAKILGDTWGGFAVTWGIVKRKEMAKARIILEEIDHSIAQLDLQQEGGWIHRRRRTQWHMKLFFILQILLMALRTAMIIYGIIKDPSYFQWEFAFDAIYKYGVVSMYFLYISFIYHKIILRYREINQMLLRLREIDIQRQPAKIMSLAEMRKLTGSLVVVINSFFAVPLMFSMGLFALNMILVTFLAYKKIIGVPIGYKFYFDLFWMSQNIVYAVLLIQNAVCISKESKKTPSIIHDILNRDVEPPVAACLKIFSTQLIEPDPVVSCGLFEINWRMANKLFYLCFTYIIIVIQLDIAKTI